MSSKRAKDWEAIKQFLENALTVYQQQFNNKDESNLKGANQERKVVVYDGRFGK